MTDITVNQELIRSMLRESFEELNPEERLNKSVEDFILKQITATPALTIPSKDIVYVHGNIPEDYIELVLTHEFLHVAVQKLMGYNKNRDPKKKPIDHFVDHPIVNGIICRALGIEPMPFYEWLTTHAFDGKGIRVLLRIAWMATKKSYILMTQLSDAMWYGKQALPRKN